MTRSALILVLLGLAACSGSHHGRDGMDGRGVAAGLRHVLNQPGR